MTKVLPVIIIVLSAGAGVVYGFAGDFRLALYWLSAASIGVSVTI